MKKVKNLKANFSKILEEKYNMTQEGIDGYWKNKAREEKYDDKKMLGASIGAGGMLGSLGFWMFDSAVHNSECIVPIMVAVTLTTLTAGISLFKTNPYTLEEYEEIDKDYEEMKEKAKQKSKRK